MSKSEKKIEFDICEELKAHGCTCVRLSEDGRRGWPDVTVMRDGRTCYLETKTPTGKLSVHQIERHNEIKAAGVPVFVGRDLNIADEILRYFESFDA